MSTVAPLSYSMSQPDAQRATAEVARRNLELRYLQAQKAKGAYQMAAVACQAEAASARATTAGKQLSDLEGRLATSRVDLTQARKELAAQVRQVETLQREVRGEIHRMEETLREARRALDHVHVVGEKTQQGAAELADAALEGALLARHQEKLDREIARLEGELRFVEQRSSLMPAAMVTLQAMQANGYRLRDTVTQQGLIAYFERQGQEHQLAVRLAPVERQGENETAWDLLAETFGLTGPECLEELEDFCTQIEKTGIGRLVANSRRVYPKDEGSARAAERGQLPKPRRHIRRSADTASRDHQEQR